MFSKRVWSFIDFKEALNKTLCSSTKSKLKIYPLYELLNLWISQGKINCFKTSDFGSLKNNPITPAAFTKLVVKSDSADERVIEENGEEKIVRRLKTDTISNDKILGFVIKEDWFFNKRSVMMEKRIIGFAPVVYDDKTQKNKELYWVYYPQCCELLSSYPTINPLESTAIFTYRDLFKKRVFSSYAVKESNVYGRDKPENSKGQDVETENNRNKEKFENYEDDLWSK